MYKKYGVDNIFKTEGLKTVVRERRKLFKEEFVNSMGISKEVLEELYKENTIQQIADHFNCSAMYIWNKLYEYDIEINYNRSTSSVEKMVSDVLTDLNVDHLQNDRIQIKPKELDIYIPENKIAIEINGLYYHNDTRKEKYYHKNKQDICKENGIDLIQFFDSEILFKQDICESMIKSRLNLNQKVYARKCDIKEISVSEYKNFLQTNHIQGYCISKIRLGLFLKDELISVMSFGKSRFDKKYEYELHRFCNKLGINVIGGAGKLFNHFIKMHNPNNIVSYCDIRLFNGKLYEKLGFDFHHNSNINYYYFNRKDYVLQNRTKYQKHKLKHILENYKKDKSEYENMLSNGYLRVWDCGNKVYVWKK